MVEMTDVNTCRTAQPFAQHRVETSGRSMLKITLATMIGGAIEAFDLFKIARGLEEYAFSATVEGQ